MKKCKFLRSALAMLLVVTFLMGMLPSVFATETTDRQQVTVFAEDLGEALGEEEAYDEAVLEALCEQYGLTSEEPEDTEFGYLTSEEKADLGLEDKGATKDVRGPNYIFLDFKAGDASRSFNWQVKTNSSKDPFFENSKQGDLAAYFSGNDPRLYMPVETAESFLTTRLNGYVLQTSDIIQVRIASLKPTTSGKYFTAGGTASYRSGFYLRTSADAATWQDAITSSMKSTTGAQTLQWSVPTAQAGNTLYGLRWDPIQPNDSTAITVATGLDDDTKIAISYIYVGPKATAPVSVEFRNESNTAILSGGNFYVGYGKKAPAFSTGKNNTENATTYTVWGWQVQEYVNNKWQDKGQFVLDPTTVTCKYNTRFVLTAMTMVKGEPQSALTYSTGEDAGDDSYILRVDGTGTAKVEGGSYGTPLDVAIVMDRSGSMAGFLTNNKCTTYAQVETKLETLSKAVRPGYYRATCFAQNKNNGNPGFDAYLYNMPMRYHGGRWEMQILDGCTCEPNRHVHYGIIPWNSTGMNPCAHVNWVDMETGFNAFVSNAKSTGNYKLGTSYSINGKTEKLYFNFGVSSLGRTQDAIATFVDRLYNSSVNLAPGMNHRVSVLSYGGTVFVENYPYSNGNGGYKTTKNYTRASRKVEALTDANYESIISTIYDTYTHGASRVDAAFQLLTGQVSAIEKNAGQTTVTTAATNYLPKAASGRKRVVVLLTDGVPSSNVNFDTTVANTAVKASALLKDDANTKVYTIGMMTGLDGSISAIKNSTAAVDMANNFLNAMSSRYRNAQVYNSAGTLTKGDYYLTGTSAGSNLATQMDSIWSGAAPSIVTSGDPENGWLYLYAELTKEWKLDPQGTIKVYAEPYEGNGSFGERILLQEHPVPTDGNAYSYAQYGGYNVDLGPTKNGYEFDLVWKDAGAAFLRETPVNTGAEALPSVGTLEKSLGYKISMEIPVAVNRENTLGGNRIPMTTDRGGAYAQLILSETQGEEAMIPYERPVANVYASIPGYIRSYTISEEDYKKLMAGEIDNPVEFVLGRMTNVHNGISIVNEDGSSKLGYVSIRMKLRLEDGTILYERIADVGATEFSKIVDVDESLLDLSVEQKIYMELVWSHAYEGTDSFGVEAYPDTTMGSVGVYRVPEIVEEPSEPTTEPTEPSEPEEPKDPIEVPELKMYHSLNLQSNISINYLVPVANLEGYDSYSVTCTVDGKEFELQGTERDGYMLFTLLGLNALKMNVKVQATLTAYKDGQAYVSPLDSYSITDYAYNILGTANISKTVKRLIVNLLRYGAISQIYKGYNIDQLPDAGLTEEQKADLIDLETVEFGDNYAVVEEIEAPSVLWYGRALSLDSTVSIKLGVNTLGYEGNVEDLEMRVSYINVDGEERSYTVKPTLYNMEQGIHFFILDALNAADLRAVVTCQVYAGEVPVSHVITYSADTYGNGKTGTLLEVCKALFAYVDAARAFFGN